MKKRSMTMLPPPVTVKKSSTQNSASTATATAKTVTSKSLSAALAVPPTILHQSTPAGSTFLMHDSRLPKKLDMTKASRKKKHVTTSTPIKAKPKPKTTSNHNTNTSSTSNGNGNNHYYDSNQINNSNLLLQTPPLDKFRKESFRRRYESPGSSSQNSSATSVTTDTTNTLVYVRDSHYVWLPAQIESIIDDDEDDENNIADSNANNNHKVTTTVIAKVVLPDDWSETTDLHDSSSVTELEYNLNIGGAGSGGGGVGGNGGKLRRNGVLGTKGNSFGTFSSRNARNNRSNSNDNSPPQSKQPQAKTQQKRRVYHYEKQHDEINGKIPRGIIRRLALKDYPNGELPLQNIERSRRGSMTAISNNSSRSIMSTRSISSRSLFVSTPTLVNARDMADLAYLHEAAILYNLKLRHANSLPYTRVGDIVVAVNPFQWIPGMYSSEKQRLYAEHLVWDVKDYDEYEEEGRKEKEKEKKKKKKKKKANRSRKPGSPFSSEDSLHSLPKDEIKTKHQPMAHGSFYSRLGLEPHVYESASLAYRGLASDQQNQTILVSGESGAGKTETVKIVMSNLATIEQTRPFYLDDTSEQNGTKERAADEITGTVQQVLESNPLFEAFGCAKTARNDNSSRFGRFTQLQFVVEDLYDAVMNSRESVPECLLVGSYCETYLLEKSRIVSHAPGERTYHIFYQLLAAPEEEKARIWKCLAGTTTESFAYIGTPSTTSIEGKSDADTWRSTVKALKSFGFDGQTLRNLMRALCVVLQLGNLTFEATSDYDDGSRISSIDELSKLSKLIGIAEGDIAIAMTLRVNKIRGEEVVVKPNPVDAKSGCDALAKTIYSQIFDNLVQQINEHTSVDTQDDDQRGNIGTISLLDIFGFEKFDTNRFEQLCINYANERLQQRYVLDNFRAVKEEYTAEGIEIFDFRMVDNSSVVDLLEEKSCIIATLNEECLRPQGSANSFVYKIKMIPNEKGRLLTDRLQEQNEFGIKHFAGAVTYDATDFLKSNTDLTPRDLLECASKSTNPLIRSELEKLIASQDTSQNGMSNRRSKSSRRTVLAKFRSQLNELMGYIAQTSVRYIRCIKPNSNMKPRITNHRQTMNQLESAGLVTAITISRETFPNRLKYDIIWERFLCLYNPEGISHSTRLFSIAHSFSFNEDQLKENVKKMLSTLLIIPFIRTDGARVQSFSCGKTKVYFRTGALEHLESERMDYYAIRVNILQSWFRCYSARWKYNRIRECIILIQAIVKGMSTRRLYLRTKVSIVMIQAAYRGSLKRKVYINKRASAIFIQTWFRCQSARRKYNTSRRLIMMFQSRIKRNIARTSYLRKMALIVKVQSKCRTFILRKAYYKARKSAILIQAFFKGRRGNMRFLEVKQNTIFIQSRIRGLLALTYYRNVIKSVIKLQSRHRTNTAMKSYKEARENCTIIQSHVRTMLARLFVFNLRQYRNTFSETQEISKKATQIQHWYRWHHARVFHGNLKKSIIVIQARHKGAQGRIVYQRTISAIITMQRMFRAFMARIVVTRMRMLEKAAAIADEANLGAHKLQRWFRCHCASRSYRNFLNSVTIIQAKHRCVIAQTRYEQSRLSALHLQRWYRSRSELNDRRVTAQKISQYRAQSVLIIQRWYRCHSARRSFAHLKRSAIQIQTAHRGATARKRFERITQSVLIIQRWYRCHSARHSFVHLKKSAIQIQTAHRGATARKAWNHKLQSVILIQSFIRMSIPRKNFLLKRRIQEDDYYQNSNTKPESLPSSSEISSKKPGSLPSTLHFTFEGQSSHSDMDDEKIESSITPSVNTSIAEKNANSMAGVLLSNQKQFLDGEAMDENFFEYLENTMSNLRKQLVEVQRENNDLKLEKGELENDKNSLVNFAQSLEATLNMSNARSLELQKSNQALIAGISEVKKENTMIRRELLLMEEERDADLAPIHRKFQKLLYDRDSEIRALKIAASNNLESRSREAALKAKKVDEERDAYLAEIHVLKNKLKEKKDSMTSYNAKLINVLEISQSSRNAETKRLKKEIKKMKREHNQEVPTIDEEQIIMSREDTIMLEEFLKSRFHVRNQMLLNIVTSAKKLDVTSAKKLDTKDEAVKEPIKRYGSFMRKRQGSSARKVPPFLDDEPTPTSQFISTVEEVYTSEAKWQSDCTTMLDNTFNKSTGPSQSPKENNVRSNQPLQIARRYPQARN